MTSSRSASQRSDAGAVPAPAGTAPAAGEQWLERLTGVGSSKRTFYAEWRRTSRGLDRTVEALREISVAFEQSARGPRALCRAVLAAVAPPFDASFAAMALSGRHVSEGRLPAIMVWPELGEGAQDPDGLSRRAREVVESASSIDAPMVRVRDGDPHWSTIAVPMRAGGQRLGSFVLHLPADAVDEPDLMVLETLSSHVAVAIENACLYEESEHLRALATAAWEEAQRQASELGKRNRQLARTRQRLVQAREGQLIGEERNRIARELHDTVAQYLVSIGMHLEWCRQHEAGPSAIHERVSVSKELARSALTHIRTTIFELGSLAEVPSGLPLALQGLAGEFGVAAGLDVRVRTPRAPCPLAPSAAHALFRIAQEAMWNVARHAGASRAWIGLEQRTEGLRLSVTDDGTGDVAVIRHHLERAAAEPGRAGDHRGLANILGRVTELGGTVRVSGRRGGGVQLVVTTPVMGAEANAPA